MRERHEPKKQSLDEYCQKTINDLISQNIIPNVFIRQHQQAQITVTRYVLALSMGVTLLFKGFWAFWIVFICLYKLEVRRINKEAWESYWKGVNKK